MSVSERIARGVHIFQCFVPVIAEIVKNESLRKLCDLRTDHFYDEFSDILDEMEVLLEIRDVVLSYPSLNNCILPDLGAQCPIMVSQYFIS